jgi:predicted anti-sigma-YlaC factor YlaD
MKCDKTREMLSLYIDKMLDDNLKKEIEEHISTCNLCKKEYDDIMEIVTHLNEVEMVSVPKSFEHRLKNALQHERSKISDSKIIAISDKKKNKLRMLTSIAAIFAVGLISVGLYQDIIGGVTDQLDGTAQLAQGQIYRGADTQGSAFLNNHTINHIYFCFLLI